MKGLRLLKHWVMGSNPSRGIDVCICFVFVLSCVGSSLEAG
jgi:hypothetical protein